MARRIIMRWLSEWSQPESRYIRHLHLVMVPEQRRRVWLGPAGNAFTNTFPREDT